MKDQILERLLQKSPSLAYRSNFDDLGTEDALNIALRQLKKEGLVTYACVQGNGWDDYGEDLDITAIELTASGKQVAEQRSSAVRDDAEPPRAQHPANSDHAD